MHTILLDKYINKPALIIDDRVVIFIEMLQMSDAIVYEMFDNLNISITSKTLETLRKVEYKIYYIENGDIVAYS